MSLFRSGLFLVLVSLLIIVSCSNSKKVIIETANVRSFKLSGRVLDEDSKKVIPNAEVWVAGTTIFSITDEDGVYNLEIPKGYYELKAGAAGYENLYRKVDFESATTHDFILSPKYAMGNYEDNSKPKEGGDVTPHQSDTAESNISSDEQINKFIDYYINDDLNCKLMNPEDVRFTDSEEGVMWVKDPVELTVMNYELGYKVIVDLKELATKQYSGILGIDKDAHYFFEELTASSPEQARTWEKNRLKYFNGSFRHFLIAMASDKSPLYFGYRIYSGQFVSNTSAMAYSSSSVSDIEVEKYDHFFPQLNGNTVLRLEGELRIEYVEKRIEDPDGIMGLDLYPNQTSWISLSIPSIEFSSNGTLLTPEYVEEKGVWRYTPVCKMLPIDYLPELNNR